MDIPAPGTVLGKTKCTHCAKPVAIKVAKTRVAYWACDGSLTDLGDGCGEKHFYGKAATRRLVGQRDTKSALAKARKPKAEESDDDEAEASTEDRKPARSATRRSDPGERPAVDAGGGGDLDWLE